MNKIAVWIDSLLLRLGRFFTEWAGARQRIRVNKYILSYPLDLSQITDVEFDPNEHFFFDPDPIHPSPKGMEILREVEKELTAESGRELNK